MKVLLSIILSFLSFTLHCQIRLVKDLNEWPVSQSDTWQPVIVNNLMFMVADDGVHQQELWKSDGTADGTMLIKDIGGLSSSGSLQELTPVNNLLFFTAWGNHVNTGRELWKSDGTPAGTVMVKDFISGAEIDGPIQLTELNGILYFLASNGFARELWRSDGSAQGTFVVKEIASVSEGVYGLTQGNGKLFFEAYSSGHGRELWVSDGTNEGTHELKDINPGTKAGINVIYSKLKPFDGGIFFIADDGVHGPELWKSDGTVDGTSMITNFYPGYEPNTIGFNEAASIGNKLYYRIGNNQIWSTSGSDATSSLVKTIIGANSNEYTFPENFSQYGSKLLFSARTGEGENSGEDLWISDGTNDGTVKLKPINETGTASIQNIKESNGKVYFSADNNVSGAEPWVTDGTPEGTHQFFDLVTGSESSYAGDFISYKGETFFTARNETFGQELFREDGTIVKDIQTRTHSLVPWPSFSFQHQLFFFDNNGIFWKTDGTDAGTIKIKDRMITDLSEFAELNGLAFFISGENFFEKHIYVTDGSTEGTKVFFNLTSRSYSTLTLHKGMLYFCDGINLYRTDGTTAGTQFIKELPGEPQILISSGDYLYFEVRDLWRSDGTEGGTHLVKDLPNTEVPRRITASKGIVYFYTDVSDGDIKLWKSDGTESGTTILKTFRPSSSWRNDLNLVDVNGVLFFSAILENSGDVLWKTDGTEVGTVVVKDLHLDDQVFSPWGFRNINGTLFFTAGGFGNDELWKSDGTAEGTVMVKHWEGNNGLTSLRNFNGELFFLSSSVEKGWGIGISDGTEAGTLVYYPQEIGAGINTPRIVDDKIFFAFDSFQYGTELYVLETASNIFCRDFSVGQLKGVDKVCVGSPIVLNTAIETENTSLTFAWLKEGIVMTDELESTLTIPATLALEGIYQVVVSNGTCSTPSNKIIITVKDVPVLSSPVLTEALSDEEVKIFLQSVPNNYIQGYQILNSAIPTDIVPSADNAIESSDVVGSDYLYWDRFINTTNLPITVQYTVAPVSVMGCIGSEVILSVQIQPAPPPPPPPPVVTGTETVEDDQFISVYPNPIQNEIRIKIRKPPSEVIHVAVYTFDGRMIYTSDVQADDYSEGKIINTGNWRSGSYYLVVRNNHERILNKKVIKVD